MTFAARLSRIVGCFALLLRFSMSQWRFFGRALIGRRSEKDVTSAQFARTQTKMLSEATASVLPVASVMKDTGRKQHGPAETAAASDLIAQLAVVLFLFTFLLVHI